MGAVYFAECIDECKENGRVGTIQLVLDGGGGD